MDGDRSTQLPRASSRGFFARFAWLAVLLAALLALSCWKKDALLDVSSGDIDFGDDLNEVAITVRNAGEDVALTAGVTVLEYSLRPDSAWVSVDPPSGQCEEGQKNTHTVAIDRSRLGVGNNIAFISVRSNGGSRTITVRAHRDESLCSQPPTTPTNPAPAPGAIDVPIDADISWSGGDTQCPGLAVSYDVYFGTTSPPPFDHDNGSSKTWDPGTLSHQTSYYCRIVARDLGGSTPGSEWAFRTASTPCTLAPTKPTTPTPVAGATGVAVNQDLSWTSGISQCVGLTATYDVYFGTTSPPPFDHNNGSVKTWDPGTLAEGTTYYWRVVAMDANGSTPGNAWSFTTVPQACAAAPTVPIAPTPANGALAVSIEQNLSWGGGNSQCAGLTASYDIYFGTTSPPPLHHNNGGVKAWDPGTLASETTYYWRIVAKDANGSTTGSEWNFRTACTAAPTAPAGPTPAGGALAVSIDQDLAWGGGDSRCPGLTATYDVYFGTTSPPPFHHNGLVKTWDPGTLGYQTSYYWRIVARDANGSTSGPEWNFRTASTPCTLGPTKPATPTPTDLATGVAINQDLSWTSGNSQCAGLTASYDIYFGTTSPPPFDHNNGSAKTWDPGTLTNGITYYWRVVAKDANGSISGSEWSFTTEAACIAAPTAPAGPTPGSGALGVSIEQNLAWGGGISQCAGLTASYDVYFGTTSPPPLHHNNGGVKTWDPGTLANGTTYYWRIVATDANGSTSGPEWSFTTEVIPCTDPPTIACTPNPPDAKVNVSENANLAWGCGDSQCPGLVATYDVYFGTSPTPTTLVGSTAVKAWVLPRLNHLVTYYWRIVTKDANGTSTGPIWSFTVKN
jgi:Viral BACON domain